MRLPKRSLLPEGQSPPRPLRGDRDRPESCFHLCLVMYAPASPSSTKVTLRYLDLMQLAETRSLLFSAQAGCVHAAPSFSLGPSSPGARAPRSTMRGARLTGPEGGGGRDVAGARRKGYAPQRANLCRTLVHGRRVQSAVNVNVNANAGSGSPTQSTANLLAHLDGQGADHVVHHVSMGNPTTERPAHQARRRTVGCPPDQFAKRAPRDGFRSARAVFRSTGWCGAPFFSDEGRCGLRRLAAHWHPRARPPPGPRWPPSCLRCVRASA